MNSDIKKIAKWAQSQGWTVSDDTKGYTHFTTPTVITVPTTQRPQVTHTGG